MVENVGFQNTLNISGSPLVLLNGQIDLANPLRVGLVPRHLL